jgi:hypothetical protein
MDTLRVYGKRGNSTEKLIINCLANTPACIARAKKTAAENGYTITRAVKIGTIETRYKDTDYTSEFFKG